MTVCTVTSRQFHSGTGALINSLVTSGYTGDIVIGYTDEAPKWTDEVNQKLQGHGITIHEHRLNSKKLPHYQKIDVIDVSTHYQSDSVFYFDSDITIHKNWDFFENWVECGIAVCSDIYYINMSPNHPVRHYWRELLHDVGLSARKVEGYANSGFVGFKKKHRSIIDVWRKLIDKKSAERGPDEKQRPAENGFHTFDQDLLNVALMAVDHPISLAGLEGMSFNQTLGYMTHAIGKRKPWQRGYLRDLVFLGKPIPIATRYHWQHVHGPVKVAQAREKTLANLELKVTAALSRLIARP